MPLKCVKRQIVRNKVSTNRDMLFNREYVPCLKYVACKWVVFLIVFFQSALPAKICTFTVLYKNTLYYSIALQPPVRWLTRYRRANAWACTPVCTFRAEEKPLNFRAERFMFMMFRNYASWWIFVCAHAAYSECKCASVHVCVVCVCGVHWARAHQLMGHVQCAPNDDSMSDVCHIGLQAPRPLNVKNKRQNSIARYSFAYYIYLYIGVYV